MPDKIYWTEWKGKIERVVGLNKKEALGKFLDMGIEIGCPDFAQENRELPKKKEPGKRMKSRWPGNRRK